METGAASCDAVCLKKECNVVILVQGVLCFVGESLRCIEELDGAKAENVYALSV